jgi:succinate dehydrogenase / fumarate reductase iron-sulfur subunit
MLHLNLRLNRTSPHPHFDTFDVEVPDEANVLGAIERAWDEHDRTLVFRHACHHASCGSCGLRINHVEKLPCITPVSDYADGATLTIEPLRNFPIIADIVVDATPLFEKMQTVNLSIIREAESLHADGAEVLPDDINAFTRFENCIECGLCLSACPAMAADPFYLGPAALAAAERSIAEPRGLDRQKIINLLDDEHGLWRCHSAFECTEVCPSNVDPAGAIMRLKRMVAAEKFRALLGRDK